MATKTGINIYIKPSSTGVRVKHNTTPQPDTQTDYDISDVVAPGESFEVQFSNVYDDGGESDLTTVQTFTLASSGTISYPVAFNYSENPDAFSPANTTGGTLYWPQILKSSEWPEINTTKAYFVLYSTDHDTGAGYMAWGEFDDFSGNILNGFVERGVIRTGDQPETPYLVRVPTSVSGLTTDTMFIYFHDQWSGNTIAQETHLLTCTGGDLHTANFTLYRNILNSQPEDSHLGYFRNIEFDGEKFIGHHSYSATDSNNAKVSYSFTGVDDWFRADFIDYTENMPAGKGFYKNRIQPIEYDGIKYGVIRMFNLPYNPTEASNISLVKLDSNLKPFEYLGDILTPNAAVRDIHAYLDGTALKIMLKTSTQSAYKLYSMPASDLASIGTPVKPDEIKILSPENNPEPYSNGDSISIYTLYSGTPSKVEFYDGVTLLGTNTVEPFNSFHLNNAQEGDYSITAKLYIGGAEVSTSQAVNFSVSQGYSASYDQDYKDILDAMLLEGITLPSSTIMDADNQKVIDLKAQGVWNELDSLLVFNSTANTGYKKFDWKRKVSVTEIGTGDWNSNGSKGNGTDYYINTGINPQTDFTNLTSQNASLGFKLTELSSDDKIIGARAVNDQSQINISTYQGDLYPRFLNSNAGTVSLSSINGGVGSHHYQVSGITRKFFFDGVEKYSEDKIDNGLPGAVIYLHTLNLSGTASGFGTARFSWLYLGSNLETKQTQIQTILG